VQCACSPGYSGLSCNECSSGFEREIAEDLASRCRLPAISDSTGPESVSRVLLQVRLNMSFALVSNDLDSFKTQFAGEIAVALGIASDRVQFQNVTNGSVVVDFSISPGLNDTATSYNDMLDELAAQTLNSASPLRNGSDSQLFSTVTEGSLAVVGFVRPTSSSSGFAALADSDFDSSQEILNGIAVHWSLRSSSIPGEGEPVVSGQGGNRSEQFLHMRVVKSSTSGWFAVGFNLHEADMPGSSTVAAVLGAASADASVQEYDLSQRSGFGSGIRRDTERNIFNANLRERNGNEQVMEFSRSLDTGDNGDHVLPPGAKDGNLFMIVAQHASANSLENSGAHPANSNGRIGVRVDLSTPFLGMPHSDRGAVCSIL